MKNKNCELCVKPNKDYEYNVYCKKCLDDYAQKISGCMERFYK